MKFEKILSVAAVVSLISAQVQAAPPTNITEAISQLNADAALLSGWMGHEFAKAMPFNSTAGNAVPSQLKLFGVSVGAGLVVSGTDVDNDGLRHLGTNLVDTSDIDMPSTLPVPMILGHAKIGLPFGMDAGVRLGGIPSKDFDEGDTHFEISNTVFGLDVRKILVEEGMVKPFGLTLGLNYTHAKGHITGTTTVDTPVSGSGVTFTDAIATSRTDWDTDSVGAQMIINKKILFMNPYLGIAANKNFGDIDSAIANTGSITHTGTATTASLDGTGGSAHEGISDWDVRGMFGLEFTFLPMLKLGIGAELASQHKMAANLGLRFQFH